jgi:hypothetical protein
VCNVEPGSAACRTHSAGGCVHSHHTCAHLYTIQLQFEPLLTKIHAVLAELWFNHWTGLCVFNYCNSHSGSGLENYHPTCVQYINWAHCRQDKEGFTMCKTNIGFIAATIQNWHNCEKKISMLFYVRIKKGLVHAMHHNGPLHQVKGSAPNIAAAAALKQPINQNRVILRGYAPIIMGTQMCENTTDKWILFWWHLLTLLQMAVDSASANTPFTILIFYLGKGSQESILLLLIVYIHVYVEYNIYLE